MLQQSIVLLQQIEISFVDLTDEHIQKSTSALRPAFDDIKILRRKYNRKEPCHQFAYLIQNDVVVDKSLSSVVIFNFYVAVHVAEGIVHGNDKKIVIGIHVDHFLKVRRSRRLRRRAHENGLENICFPLSVFSMYDVYSVVELDGLLNIISKVR